MIKRLLTLISLIIATSSFVFSQQGTLKGKIFDKSTKEPLAFASIIIESGGRQFAGTQSDENGEYLIKPITPGKYDIKATYMGYHSFNLTGIIILADGIRFLDIEMNSLNIELKEVEIKWKPPLIDKGTITSGTTMTSDEIEKLPTRSAQGAAIMVGGVSTDENGNMEGIRGQRSSGTAMYVDGIRVTSIGGLPQSALDQVQVIIGGTPAQYGDVTGGVISVTTKGPTRQFGAGMQYETSELFGHQHYNLLGFSIMGPLIADKDKTKNSAMVGFFLAGELSSSMAGKTALDEYTVNDELKNKLKETPLRPSGTGAGTFLNSEFITKDDLVKIKEKPYSLGQGIDLSGKLDVRVLKNVILTWGGNFSYGNSLGYSRANSLLNSENNGRSLGYNYRFFWKGTQVFPNDKGSKSALKNVYYSVQVDYSAAKSVSEDATHQDDLFKYGYLGKFTTYRQTSYDKSGYDPNAISPEGVHGVHGWIHNGYADTLFDFQQADFNRTTGNYTAQYYNLFPKNSGAYRNYTNVQENGGLLNGSDPPSVYGLWSNTGSRVGSYGFSTSSQTSLSATASADIKNHNIQFGFEVRMNTYRSHSIAASGLWNLMRQIVNKHIIQLDKDFPQVSMVDGHYQVDYYRKYNSSEQSFFDKNLRNSIGLSDSYSNPADSNFTAWKQAYIDIDSYDMNNHTINYYGYDGKMHTVSLNQDLTTDWFSADDLINSGHSYVGYYGYEYNGKKLNGNPTLDDFFTKKDANGNFTREIAPYQPIYVAGYIQDKFSFNDLLFNIGLRVDRIDLNQKVLKDPYLFYDTKTVKDVHDDWAKIPSNMGDDYVVYVDNFDKPQTIMGFRNGDTWYNSKGTEISDPTELESAKGIQPYLVDPTQQELNSSAFKDYKPQITYQPRIAFGFPISDEARFFAHYDILCKRPTDGTQLDLLSYLFIENAGTSVINNPNLKPEKTINYELGFEQKLSNVSSLKLSAYYSEMRDQVQSFRYYEAYPKTYISYNNIDFGTVKGFNITYDLRRTNNVWVKASYDLRFADGTGSDAGESMGLVASGQPNLRTTHPLSYDKRHDFKLTMDYRFAEGKDYNGPVIKRRVKGSDEKQSILLLQNTGINVQFRGGSGSPYTARSIVGNTIKGSLYGSRLPWQFVIDARIDKDFKLKIKSNKTNKEKFVSCNAYVTILNVLDSKNIIGVYSTTGNPDDNGYLSAIQNQNTIRATTNEQSYRDLYSLYINNPGNYMLPRRVRIGLQFNL